MGTSTISTEPFSSSLTVSHNHFGQEPQLNLQNAPTFTARSQRDAKHGAETFTYMTGSFLYGVSVGKYPSTMVSIWDWNMVLPWWNVFHFRDAPLNNGPPTLNTHDPQWHERIANWGQYMQMSFVYICLSEKKIIPTILQKKSISLSPTAILA